MNLFRDGNISFIFVFHCTKQGKTCGFKIQSTLRIEDRQDTMQTSLKKNMTKED